MVKPRCYLDISIGPDLEGRIVVELHNNVVPKTSENFRALCTGEKGVSSVSGLPLHYKGTCIYRIMKGVMVEGGDITAGNGTGGESIYGTNFEDENFELRHERKGILSMANSGPNTNASQFIITATRTPHLDGKHVVFGRVLKGFGVIRAIEHVSMDDGYHPILEVKIVDCGEIPEEADDGVSNFFKDGDLYPDWPGDLDESPSELSWWINAADKIKAFGNENFKKQNFKMALRKYRKALGYLDICWDKDGMDEETSLSLRKTKAQIYTNCSASKFKLEDFNGALWEADFALREAKDSAKALFRQGQAYMALKNIDAAVESFKRALELEPNDSGIRKELAAVNKMIVNRRDGERKAFGKMFK